MSKDVIMEASGNTGVLADWGFVTHKSPLLTLMMSISVPFKDNGQTYIMITLRDHFMQ